MNPDNLPGNSNKAKERPKPDVKKIDPVVTGTVKRQKVGLGQKFKETFFSSESGSVGEYILFEVLVPAVKDTIAELVQQTVERTFFGGAANPSRRGGVRPGGTGYTNYSYRSAVQDPRQRPGPEQARTQLNRRARSTHNFEQIVLATRAEAELVIRRMYELLERYETVSVSDLYELLDISGEYTDEKWGWTEFPDLKPIRVRDGYLLNLSQPEPLS